MYHVRFIVLFIYCIVLYLHPFLMYNSLILDKYLSLLNMYYYFHSHSFLLCIFSLLDIYKVIIICYCFDIHPVKICSLVSRKSCFTGGQVKIFLLGHYLDFLLLSITGLMVSVHFVIGRY